MTQQNVSLQKAPLSLSGSVVKSLFPSLCHPLLPAYLMQKFLSWCLRFIPRGLVHFSLCTVLICPPRLSERILHISFSVQIVFSVVQIFRLSVMMIGNELGHSVPLFTFLGLMKGTNSLIAQCTVSCIQFSYFRKAKTCAMPRNDLFYYPQLLGTRGRTVG
jgi:hypothetical protein